MKASDGLTGTIRYEFLMQTRRPALWAVMALFCLSFVVLSLTPWGPFEDLATTQTVANWALSVQFLHPLAAGILLADRVPHDRKTKASELLETLPAQPVVRFAGKYVGATLATVLPLAMIFAAGIGYILFQGGGLMAVPLGVAAFLTINLPGLLFVAAFSISCPVILWVPLYQFLFVGYWFWGNLLPTGFSIPTFSHTVLSPLGEFVANGFFGTQQVTPRATVLEGVTSMALLLGLAALALVCGHAILRRRTT